MTAQFSSLSGVEAPRWGMAMTFFTVAMVSLGKSVTYLATRPVSRAAIMSWSHTSSPRARFRMRTPPFILAMASPLMKSLVELV